jgi:hypothetical protein
MKAFRSLEEAAVDSPGRSGRGNGNRLDERRRCGTKSIFDEIGFSQIARLKIIHSL